MNSGIAADCIYAPILKWKEGEQSALRDLRFPIDDMRPVIELVPTRPPSEPKPRKVGQALPPVRSMESQTHRAIGKAMDAVGHTGYAQRPFYLDASALTGEKIPSGKGAVEEVYEQLRIRRYAAIPVVGVRIDGSLAGSLPAWAEVACYRVDASGGTALDTEAIRRSADGRRVHVVLDFRSVAGAYVGPVSERMAHYTASAANGAFESVIIAASAFPDGLHGVERDSVDRIDRVDWLAWRRYRRKAVDRKLACGIFADYGIQHPRNPVARPNTKQTAGIRYTLDRQWLIVRGHVLSKDDGAAQFVSLAEKLVGRPDFMKASHCFGCRAVQDTADQAGDDMIVDLRGWRRYGTVHHLTTTLQQMRAGRA